MNRANHRFERSLRLAQACLVEPGMVLANGHSLGLDLPPLFDLTVGVLPRADSLRALAALYLYAELEQTGLIQVTEWLAEERASLALRSEQAAARLERFAQQRDALNRTQRLQLFARLFGLGGASQDTNNQFQQQFAQLCQAIGQVAEEYRWTQRLSPTREASLRMAVRSLLFDLGSRQAGNTLLAGRKLQSQVQAAVQILGDPAIGGLVQGQGVWDTLRKILGSQSPDLGRLLNRGQSGQRLLTWLALALAEIQRDPPTQALLPAGSPAFVWAATWLEATGLHKPQAG